MAPASRRRGIRHERTRPVADCSKPPEEFRGGTEQHPRSDRNCTHPPSNTEATIMRVSVRHLLAIGAFVPGVVAAQQPATPLTLGDAARLAARQSVPSLAAQLRTREAAARVTQSRSELLPTFNALALQSGHTLNTATFGFKFPAAEGSPPLFDPNGQILGPVNTLDIRGRVTVPAIDFAARERVNTARLSLRASEASAQSAGEEAAATAATAYVRAARA